MEGTVVERSPEAHCYRCGAVAISGVCVQCQRLMCQEHLTPPPKRLMRWLGRLFYRLRIVNQPYDGSVVLCHDCHEHFMLPLLATVLAMGVAYIGAGVWFGVQGNLWGGALILIGLIWLGLLWLAPRRLEDKNARQRRKTLQVTPHVDKRQIEEWARGHIVLDDAGDYHVKELSANGQITLLVSFSEADGKRAQSLLKKRRWTRRKSPMFNAGFFVFKGRISTRPAAAPAFQISPVPGPVVALSDKIDNASFLTSTGGREARQWKALYAYSLIRSPEERNFPVQLLPAIRPDSGQRVLDLTVQWINPFTDIPAIVARQIQWLRLRVPMSWGSIEYASAGCRSETEPGLNGDKDAVRVLTWERVPLSQRDQEGQRRLFTAKFENPIDQAATIRGLVRVSFYNSLSGVTGVEYLTPAGKLSPMTEGSDVNTIGEASYDLSLATLRYQKTLAFPPPPVGPLQQEAAESEAVHVASDELTPEELAQMADIETPREASIAPDAETVVQLTNALSEAGFYIQWIVENRPHIGATASVTNRHWDVGGRYYQGVNPIDFHMVISGEQSSQQGESKGCKTTVNLRVTGAYITEPMKQKIINTWIKLDDVVKSSLKALEVQQLKDEV